MPFSKEDLSWQRTTKINIEVRKYRQNEEEVLKKWYTCHSCHTALSDEKICEPFHKYTFLLIPII